MPCRVGQVQRGSKCVKPELRDVAEFYYPYLYEKNKGVFYRGTCSKRPQHTGVFALGEGKYLTWDKGMAEAYAINACKDYLSGEGKPVVEAYKFPQGLKLLDAQSSTMAKVKGLFGLESWEYTDNPIQAKAMTHEIKKLGYDGVISDKKADGLVIFDEKKIKRIKSGGLR
jgi:hypothetical protein